MAFFLMTVTTLYSETDRTGAVQKTIYYCQRPPPNYMMY